MSGVSTPVQPRVGAVESGISEEGKENSQDKTFLAAEGYPKRESPYNPSSSIDHKTLFVMDFMKTNRHLSMNPRLWSRPQPFIVDQNPLNLS